MRRFRTSIHTRPGQDIKLWSSQLSGHGKHDEVFGGHEPLRVAVGLCGADVVELEE
jgi:hypothetical protein